MVFTRLYIVDGNINKGGFIKIWLFEFQGINLIYITRQLEEYKGDKKYISINYERDNEIIRDLISKEIGIEYRGEKLIEEFPSDVWGRFMKKRKFKVC